MNNNPNTIAKTIIAGNAAKITAASAAPIIIPITSANATNKIMATIPKQCLFLAHFSSRLS